MADLLSVSVDDRVPQALRAVLSPEMTERILDIVAAGARNEWIRLARQELHTSKAEYLRGIQRVESEPHVRIIALVGWFANAVETGLSAFDMRETLLGPKSKIRRKAKGGGFYARVPFRHGTPTSAGLAGTPMGSSYGPVQGASRRVGGVMGLGEAQALGKSIYDLARRLPPTKAGPGMKTRWGERMPTGMAPLLRGPNPSHPDPRMRAGHKTDIYAGMVREQHTYAKATQTQYMTWRTISSNNSSGWIHPGITAHHLADRVGEYIARILPAAIDQVVKAALGPGYSGAQPTGGGSGGGTPPAGASGGAPAGGGGPGSATPWGLIR